MAAILQQLATIIDREVREEVKLVVGVEKEVRRLSSNLSAIEAVLEDAEKKQLKDAAVKDWLAKLKEISYDMDNLVDEWNTAITKKQIASGENAPLHGKVLSSILRPCVSLAHSCFRYGIARKIKEMDERLSVIAVEKDRFNFSHIRGAEEPERLRTTSFFDESEVRGRDGEKALVLTELLSGSQSPSQPYIMSVVGMGGIGKTTLAQLVYNDKEVIRYFDRRIWVCVSDPFDEVKVAKAILQSLNGDSPNYTEFETILVKIHEAIVGNKFLLILDDVWTEDRARWEPLHHCLKCGAQGSRILVTTRKETVALMMETNYRVTLESLSEKDCWSLFGRIAFFGRRDEERESLEDVGKEIVKKCKGLPLAAKTLGSLLRFKRTREEWQSVMNSELWELEEAEKGIFPPLLLSYYDLPSTLRRCFSYCAVFPKDYKIEKDRLIKLWMAQGYIRPRGSQRVDIVAQEYFDHLAMRSFFQDFEKDEEGDIVICKMHDIVHDVAQFLTKNECLLIEVNVRGEPKLNLCFQKACHSTMILPSGAPFLVSPYDGKKLRSLLLQFIGRPSISAEALHDLFDQLTCLRALDLHDSLIEELPREIGKLRHLRFLDLSYNVKLKVLPESLCDLCNLQSLNISGCNYLKSLPCGIGKLINLRFIDNSQTVHLSFIPQGIGRLTSLQRLTMFFVTGKGKKHGASTLADLKYLNHLQGTLQIGGLGNVANVAEAKKAELLSKKYLAKLQLSFDGKEANSRMIHDSKLLEALEPPPDLKCLSIQFNEGKIVSPNWMMSLAKLKELKLIQCNNCEHLPPLGKLLSLESLVVSGIRRVKNVGIEFLGIKVDGAANNPSIVAFPNLKLLKFGYMDEWQEWDFRIPLTAKIMPCLQSLVIESCPKLEAVPDHILESTQLKTLDIKYCPCLSQRYQEDVGDDWPKISHVPNIIIDLKAMARYGNFPLSHR